MSEDYASGVKGFLTSNKKLMEFLEIDGCFLAGGAIRDALGFKKPKDYDLFFTSEKAFKEAISLTCQIGAPDPWVSSFDIENDIFQLVHKEFSPEIETIKGFDFNSTLGFFDGRNVYLEKEMVSDCVNQEVTINMITNPLASLNRLTSYVLKKWDIHPAYKYIISVMADKHPHICLMGSYYEESEEKELTQELASKQ